MALLNQLKMFAARLRGEPKRDTDVYPRLMQLGRQRQRGIDFKPSPPNLRYFSRTPYARRAINAIKNPIAQLEWEITPIKGVKLNSALQKQMDIVAECFRRPNRDDNFHSLIEKVVEDYLVCGAGIIEQQLSNDMRRPLWLWPVDAQSIQIYSAWDGSKSQARYVQTIGYQNIAVYQGNNLRNDEIINILANPSTQTPYGYGPLEMAFNTISRQLAVAKYAGNLASNAQPKTLLWMGEVDQDTVLAFRNYWNNEVEGQGTLPSVGWRNEPKAIDLHTGTDDALYLKYQEFVIREIATAFNLSPQNLGIEADVNRNTSEVSEDRDWDAAIKPVARVLASYLSREAIQARLGFQQLEFRFIGLDRDDEEATAKIFETYYKSNVLTPNEQRERLGLPPLDNEWGDKVFADTQVALQAARGTGVIDDTDLPALDKPSEKSKPQKENEKP